jgi:hypothetical protein
LTAIDPAARLAALMRSQLGALRRPQPASRTPGQPAQRRAAAGDADLAAKVALRLRAIDPQDPDRDSKAARIYLESVLLAELGPGLANDPAFALMVDDVHAQMAGDPPLARALAEAAALLLERAAGGAC